MWADPRVTKYIGGTPSTQQQTWARILTYTGHWQLMGYGYWAIEEKHSGAFVGEIGFADFKRAIDPSMSGVPELGFALASAFHARGYAAEAVSAVLAWGDEQWPGGRTVAIVSPENSASLHLLERAKYVQFKAVTFNGKETSLFERQLGARQSS